MRPDISVVMPAHNEGARVAETIESIASTRTTNALVEIVVADDKSDDDAARFVRAAWPDLSRHDGLHVHLSRLPDRRGVPRARNHAARLATGEILFITDAHVRFPTGWDALVQEHLRPGRVLAGVVTQSNTSFAGYGCQLVIPFMGTYWNKEPVDRPVEVQIAACPATVLSRTLFDRLGGYDDGMIMYGAAEPEFSLRAWLSGAEVVLVPQLVVEHRFKPQQERVAFVRSVREHMVHNSLRFGLLYADEDGAFQLLRYYALKFPNLFQPAVAAVNCSDVWSRRDYLQATLERPFSWFVDHFGLKDKAGGGVL